MINMTESEINEKWSAFTEIHSGLTGMIILDKSGKILNQYGDSFASEEECSGIMNSWLGENSAFHIGVDRYVILKREPIQLVCTNRSKNLGIIGSISKSGKYGIVQMLPECSTSPLVLSIEFNRWIWEIV